VALNEITKACVVEVDSEDVWGMGGAWYAPPCTYRQWSLAFELPFQRT